MRAWAIARAVRAKCQQTLDDPAYQARVVAESLKLGHSKEEALQQARNIIAAIDHYFN